MSRAPLFESFDEAVQDAPEEPSVEDLPGYEDGYAAATLEHESRQTGLRAELVQSISELGLTYAEARQDILNGLSDLFSEITSKVLPETIERTFGAHVLEALTSAAESASDQPLVLRVHPAHSDAMREGLSDMTGLSVNIVADPSLTEHAALVSHARGEVLLDLDSVLEGITDVLALLRSENDTEGMQAYG